MQLAKCASRLPSLVRFSVSASSRLEDGEEGHDEEVAAAVALGERRGDARAEEARQDDLEDAESEGEPEDSEEFPVSERRLERAIGSTHFQKPQLVAAESAVCSGREAGRSVSKTPLARASKASCESTPGSAGGRRSLRMRRETAKQTSASLNTPPREEERTETSTREATAPAVKRGEEGVGVGTSVS